MKSAVDDRGFLHCFILIAAVQAGAFTYFVQAASIRVPVYDLLDWLQFYGDRWQSHDWLGYLWTPHNEHRLVWSRLLLVIDVNIFSGSGTAFAISGYLLLFTTVAVICRLIIRSDLLTSCKITGVAAAVVLLMPASIVVVIGMPAMAPFLHTAAFSVFALLLLDGAGPQVRFSAVRILCALAMACLAAFGGAGGLLIWPVLLWTGWRRRLDWRWLAGILGVGILFAAFYLQGLPRTGGPTVFDLSHIVRHIDYAIRFLGLPWSHVAALVWPAQADRHRRSLWGHVFAGPRKSVAAPGHSPQPRRRWSRAVCTAPSRGGGSGSRQYRHRP